MSKYSLAHLSAGALLAGLKSHVTKERGDLAFVLAYIAEIEAQELYRPAGYSSMHMYCVHELHLSKDAAYKRITAARLARRFPAIFERVAEGALRLNALNLLASHLQPENAEDLVTAAAFRSDFEVREILAERSPGERVPTTVEPLAEQGTLTKSPESLSQHAGLAAQRVQGDVNPLQMKPIAADLYKATFTMSRVMRDKLGRVKDLLGYRKSVPDEAEILETGVDLYIALLEKKKFGATDRQGAARRSNSPGYICNAVKREVFKRDGGRCTFVSEDGTRCPEISGVEWDHIVPVARGGGSEPSNVRLRCRAHNQLEAERAFGKPFMEHKRRQAKVAAATKREQAKAAVATKRRQAEDAECAAQEAREHDEFLWWMGILGFSAAEAELAGAKFPPRPGQLPEMRRLTCLAFLRERQALQATGT